MTLKLISSFCLIVVVNFHLGKATLEKCALTYKKVGCFNDRIFPDRSISTELIDKKDLSNHNWDLHTLDWHEWPESLHALVCACAEKAKSFGYKLFGLYFFGKCWSGSLLDNNRGEPSTNCIGDDFKPCNDSSPTECVGKANTNYIYSFEKEEKSPTNGGWSDWGDWTECSAKCNGGFRYRQRTCNNHLTQGVGDKCEGEAVEKESCNKEACEPLCTEELEIGILLDASGSVTSANWKKTIAFVEDFSKQFKMGFTGVRFAVIDFSDDAILQVHISDSQYWSQEAFSKKVNSIEYSRGRTRTDAALALARQQIFCNKCGLRSNVPKLLIVLTDGQSTFPGLTQHEARLLKDENKVNIISLGVGDKVDIEELKGLATDRDHVFLLNGYSYLNDKINNMLKISCPEKQKNPINGGWGGWSEWTECSASCNGGVRIRERLCNNPLPQNGGADCDGEGEEEDLCNVEACEPVCTSEMEIAILLDASGSVTSANWKRTIEFVQDFSKEFRMGPTGVRFAVIDFSDEAILQVNILDPRYWRQETFSKKVSGIEYSRGRTRTDAALQLARKQIFCDECGLRANIPKLVLVLTDGQSTYPDLTLREARLIKNQASVICMGVGDKVDLNELNAMATDKDHVFLLNGYKYINDKINQILKVSCKKRKN